MCDWEVNVVFKGKHTDMYRCNVSELYVAFLSTILYILVSYSIFMVILLVSLILLN